MKKLLKIYQRIFKISFMVHLTDRENFFAWCAVRIIGSITTIVFINSVFTRVQSINGWSQDQSLLVMGVGLLIAGLGSLTFFPFMYEFGKKILKGEFDATLTKPINTLFISAFCWVDLEEVISIPISIFLIVYAVNRIGPSNILFNIILFLMLIIASLLILFSVFFVTFSVR